MHGLSVVEMLMIYITEVHMVDGSGHEHIADLRWRNPQSGKTGESSREALVRWIRDKDGTAKVHGQGTRDATVGVVTANPPYLRTYADGVWTNNLLSLPRY